MDMPNATRQPMTINISREAADHVRDFAGQAGKPGTNLRVGVKGGGCSGLTYMLDLVEEPKDDDKVIRDHGTGALRRPEVIRLPRRHDAGVLRGAQRQGVRLQQPQRKDDLRLRHLLQRLTEAGAGGSGFPPSRE